MNKRKLNYVVILIVSAIFFFIPFLGKVHLFDWDEINFAESAREMLLTGNYGRVQINFEPFWEKPPLFFWMQCAGMKIFGINEFASRFPNAVCGIVTLLTFYFLGRKFRNEQFGFVWALCYLGSFLPHLYFKSGIIDPWFNYFIFSSVWLIYESCREVRKNIAWRYAALAGVAAGLAVLTKGPVALIIISLTVLFYFIFNKRKLNTGFINILTFGISALLITSLWFGFELIRNGPWFLKEFIAYQADLFLHPVAGHEEPLYYHFLVVFLGCFPISIFAIPVLAGKTSVNKDDFLKWMKVLFWVVMILFTIVKTKIVHYSSMSYFPLSFLAAVYLNELLEKRRIINKSLYLLLIVIGSVFSLLLIMAPIVAQHKEWIIPYLNDPFAVDCLNSPVEWGGWESMIGIIYLMVIIRSIFNIKKNTDIISVTSLFYATAFCMFFYLVSVVPKIEAYSQAPAIRFYQKMQRQNVYVWPYGFKSYAQYFYFQKPDYNNRNSADVSWLLNGKIDKDVYLIAKTNSKQELDTLRQLVYISKEGGFLVYKRSKTGL